MGLTNVEAGVIISAVASLLAAWSLLVVLNKQWVLAGALAARSALRSWQPIVVAAAVNLLQARRSGEPSRKRVLLGTALAPLGWVGYILWVAGAQGRSWATSA